jgi:hypothetical protein
VAGSALSGILYSVNENISLYFVVAQLLLLCLIFPFHSSYDLLCTFISKPDCNPLTYCYRCCLQTNEQVVFSQLMHSIVSRVAQSVQCLATDWKTGRSRFGPGRGK